MVFWLAQRHGGLTLRELGARAGGVDYNSVALGIKRLTGRAGRDKRLARIMKTAEQRIRALIG